MICPHFILLSLGIIASALALPTSTQADSVESTVKLSSHIFNRDIIKSFKTTHNSTIPVGNVQPESNKTSSASTSHSDSGLPAFYTLQPFSKWEPGDVSNIIIGCITVALTVIGIGLTYLRHRRSSCSQRSGIKSSTEYA